jgi:hypothetical protein
MVRNFGEAKIRDVGDQDSDRVACSTSMLSVLPYRTIARQRCSPTITSDGILAETTSKASNWQSTILGSIRSTAVTPTPPRELLTSARSRGRCRS